VQSEKLRLWHLFIIGRSAVTGVLLAFLAIINALVLPKPQVPLFVLTSIQFALNGMYLYLWRGKDTTALGYVAFSFEIALITLLIFFLGPDGYTFMLAYLWPIIVGGWLIGRQAVLPLTLFSAIAYALLVMLGRQGIYFTTGLAEPAGRALSLILNVPYLAFLSLLVWMLTTEIEGSQQNLEARNQELNRINAKLHSLVTAGEDLLGCLDLKQLLAAAMAHIEQITGRRRMAIYIKRDDALLLEQERDLPAMLAQQRRQTQFPAPWRSAERTPSGSLAIVQEPLEEALGDPTSADDATPRWLTHIPLRSQHGLEGMLSVVSTEQKPPDAGEAQILQILGHQLGIALENARLVDNLQHERNLLSGILADMAEGVFVVSQEGQVLLANRAAHNLLQVCEQEPLPIYLMQQLEIGREAPIGESRRQIELAGKTISISRAELSGAGDVPTSTIFVARDITQEAQVEQMKSDFVAYASHELRTPLTTIKMLVRLLLMDTPKETKPHEYLSIISTQAERQTRLVTNLLDFTRLEAGKYELAPEEVSTQQVLQSAVSVCRPLAEEKGLRVHTDGAEAPSRIISNAGGLEQVLINLLSNAIKFTDKGGRVAISCRREGEDALFVVEDSGIGMTSEQLGRIFNKFYTVRNPRKHGEGTGLGLVISDMIVKNLGGRIEVASQPGAGSRFTVRLPIKGPAHATTV